jgi:hypothetical protein
LSTKSRKNRDIEIRKEEEVMENVSMTSSRLKALFDKYYRYFPYFSLALGFATIFFWERDFEFIRWGFIYLIAIAAMTFAAVRVLAAYRERHKFFSYAAAAVEFINQNLYQDMLFFLLPFYWNSSTFMSLNFGFVAVIFVLCIIATFDDVYRRLLLKNIYARYVFFVFVMFLFLNFSLSALFGIRNIWSLYLSIFISLALLTPVFIKVDFSEGVKRKHALYIAAIGAAAFALLSAAKPFIPPVPLMIKHGTASAGIDRKAREPVGAFKEISSAKASEVYCYTSIFAPHGVHEKLWHIWKRDGEVVQKVQLDISGGRKEGFRTWSKKSLNKSEDAGRWHVDVVTDSGQIIGRVRFKVVM